MMLVVAEIILFFLQIVFSFAGDNSYKKNEHSPTICLLLLIPIIVCGFQIYVMKMEYDLLVPLMWWHKLYWTLDLLILIVGFFLVSIGVI